MKTPGHPRITEMQVWLVYAVMTPPALWFQAVNGRFSMPLYFRS